MASSQLHLVPGGAAAPAAVAPAADPVEYQQACLRDYEASQAARGFAQTSMDNQTATLERFLTACGQVAWEVTPADVDRVVAGLRTQGLAASTRRQYVQAFKGFHAFLSARKAGDIEARFGVRLVDPVDEFNAAHHVGADSPSTDAPPTPERMEEFFDFLKVRIAGARKYAAAGRDYTLFRALYLAGLRAEESASMDHSDVHFGRGPFGKLHVRFGKGTHTSGPRPRWVPMLDGLDLILRWYLDEIRPRFGEGAALFCDEGVVGSTAARSATVWRTCWSWNGRRVRTSTARLGSARTRCAMRVRPATTSVGSTSSRSNRCSAIGMSGPRCDT